MANIYQNATICPAASEMAIWKSPPSTSGMLKVSRYSRCDISRESDKLVAISGVAKVLKDPIDSDYVAGVWAKHIQHGLLWTGAKPPPWSWATYHGPIIHMASESAVPMCHLQSTSTKPKAGDSFGEILSASIVLKGRRIQVYDPEHPGALPPHATPRIDRSDPTQSSTQYTLDYPLDTGWQSYIYCLVPIFREDKESD
ncbi:hypothetical protein ACJZ2D_016831 [Fusarium nematophilum]